MAYLRKWFVLCWIIRGLNAKTKQLALLNAIKLSGCDVVCLQETKNSHFDLAFIKSCCPSSFDEFAYVPSNGASGGLIIIWKSSVFIGLVRHCQPFALSVHFTAKQDALSWTLINIYGPCNGDLRDAFVEWLYDLAIPDDENWLIAGDFNFIRSPTNRNKPGGNVDDMLLFNDIVRAQHLTELPIKGRSFTWSNMQQDPLLEQLDWFFTSLHWNVSYPATVVTPQGKPTSDHTPCIVSIQTTIPACRLFRFENYWTAHTGFLQTVATSWSKPTHKKNSAANLNAKFKRLRYDIKFWSRNISRLSICIENCNKALLELDNLEDRRGLTILESNFRNVIKKHLLALLDYQRQYWKKRCTIRWTKFGDENTKFFHSLATERHRRTSIANLVLPDGQVVSSHAEKEEVIYKAFKERLGTCHHPAMAFDLASLIQPVEGLQVLTEPFSTTEIDAVVREMPSDKAPGPDGFNGHFLKSCWHIVKEDIYSLCNEFYEGKLNLESINSGYITLIPKIGSPESVNDYRPITLLNCFLKLLTKILANRLQKVILKVVHKNQYGFLKGRTIQDCIAWDFEFIH